MAKTIAGTYLYRQYSEYEKSIIDFLMNGAEIDKESNEFADIVYDVKRRQISNCLVRVLMSKKVVLMIAPKPLATMFRVSCLKDIRKDAKSQDKKIFIDCSYLIKKDTNGKYVCSNIDILIAYLVSAMVQNIYYIDENRLLGNAVAMKTSTSCFAAAMTYIVDYVAKISVIPNARIKTIYLSSLYYLSNVCEKDINNDSVKKLAIRIADISEREAESIDLQVSKDSFTNIKTFIDSLASALKISKLSLDVVVEKWMYLFGESTVFSLEHFPTFSSMITDTYVGCYLNNQKTIEKVFGKDMVEYTKTILQIGGDAV